MTFLQGFKGGSTTFLSKSGAERVEVVPKIGNVHVWEPPDDQNIQVSHELSYPNRQTSKDIST
jgi:hypothetical protein